MQWRYGIIDNLNVQWKKPLDLPATLTVGRQDIFLGDGWLVGDGTPEDGSFTLFLDSARFTYDLKDQHTTIDAIGIVQYARPDAWLPTLGPSTTQWPANPEPLLLTDQNEKGAILWIANKSLPAANLDGYFIYKHDTRINNHPAASFRRQRRYLHCRRPSLGFGGGPLEVFGRRRLSVRPEAGPGTQPGRQQPRARPRPPRPRASAISTPLVSTASSPISSRINGTTS